MLKKMNLFIVLLAICSVFATFPAFADAADDDSGLEDSMTFHVYDDVDLVSTLKFEYGKPRIIIKSVYPQLASETDHDGVNSFNETSLQIVQDEIAKFRSIVKSNAAVQKKMAKGTVANNLYIDYNTSYIKPNRDHIISIRFSVQGFSSGDAYPFHDHIAFNYNLDKGQRIELSDLFIPNSNYLDVLSAYTSKSLERQLKVKNMIADGTAPKPENFQIWNLKPNGLLITFNESQVAPRVLGSQSILVPYSALSQVIAPDSPIDDCMKHNTKCARNNLLTGGFIDEAANTKGVSAEIAANSNHSRLNPILG